MTRLRFITFADDRPIAVGARTCSAARFPRIAETYRELESFSEALSRYGVLDYRRALTEISARMPDPAEARALNQPETRPVLTYLAVDEDLGRTPIATLVSVCAADRMTFVIDDR